MPEATEGAKPKDEKAKAEEAKGDEPKIDMVEWEKLYLDPSNPRLSGSGFTVNDQDAMAKVLWNERAVSELVDSIAESGFWSYEPLFAAREGGKLVVVEGNRRLAAVKLLLDEKLRKVVGTTTVPAISEAVRATLQKLPVIECKRSEVWGYVGFKHVNGPQEWDSIAKAEYIAIVRERFKRPLDEIARRIGDRNDTVKRLYWGYVVLRQAEQHGLFDRSDSYRPHFAFSHLWTGIGYSNIRAWLGLSKRSDPGVDPVPKSRHQNLRELCRWLYGSKSGKTAPVVESQNPDLRHLDEALASKDGVAALRAKLSLEAAIKRGRGDEALLREALVTSEQALRDAKGLAPTGFAGQLDLLEKARDVSTLAESLLQEMQRIAPAKKRK